MTTLESVRAKVVKVVPELGVICDCDHCKSIRPATRPPTDLGRPIQLSDVLRAISKANEGNGWTYACTAEGNMILLEWNDHTVKADWNLALPLDDQSPEVLEFLDKILTN